jgi:hypothetical protein
MWVIDEKSLGAIVPIGDPGGQKKEIPFLFREMGKKVVQPQETQMISTASTHSLEDIYGDHSSDI